MISRVCVIVVSRIMQSVSPRQLVKDNTVKLRIEAPGFYQYKLLGPPVCIRDTASIRGFTVDCNNVSAVMRVNLFGSSGPQHQKQRVIGVCV